MSAFIELRPQDIIYTEYRTHPSYALLLTQIGNDYYSENFRIETDADFEPGSERNSFGVDGGYFTGSWNLSGAVQMMTGLVLSALPESRLKNSIYRLRDTYADNNFVRPQNYSSSSIFSASAAVDQYMTIFNIPSVLYGEEIKPGSFNIDIKGAGDNIWTDDGYGGILSNSVVVGSIFYQHGIVALGHTSEEYESEWGGTNIYFSGTNTIPMMMYVCNAPRGMLNFSRNSSFTVYNSASNKNEITTKTNKTFITTIGLYDEDYELMAVAKVGTPILNEENGAVQFRLKLNF